MQIEEYIRLYRDNLLEDVIPFWENHSIDKEHGGFFTCLDTEGRVYDTDKFIWLQARQVWCFSMLYNQVEQKKEWLDIAEKGAGFLLKHGRDQDGSWYFSLDRQGRPLVAAYNIFSDCFAAMAFAQLFKATGNEQYNRIAVNTFHNILKRQDNPKGIYNKGIAGTRPMKAFSLPMILSNLVLEMEHSLDPALVETTINTAIHEVMEVFYNADKKLVMENVAPDGSQVDSFEGRLINPGHGMEAMWFMMDLGARTGNKDLIQKATETSLNILEFGWDKTYGGIFYFLDIRGLPPQQLEWDQKLWWVHAESLVCLLKGYYHTGNPKCLEWYEKIHEYTWSHFPDKDQGEWFAYLNRRGEVLLPIKGGKWKGCFHVPRSLFQCWKTLEAIEEKNSVII